MTAADLVRVAQRYLDLGVHEVPTGSNSGPFIDDWIRALGLPPGLPWCAAAACAWVKEANGGSYPDGFHPSASGLRLLQLNAALCLPRPWAPQPGDIAVWAHGHGTSHVAVVETVGDGTFQHISGNTNTNGSRDGEMVARNISQLDNALLAGFIRAWRP